MSQIDAEGWIVAYHSLLCHYHSEGSGLDYTFWVEQSLRGSTVIVPYHAIDDPLVIHYDVKYQIINEYQPAIDVQNSCRYHYQVRSHPKVINRMKCRASVMLNRDDLAAVAALRSLQAKLNETERDRQRESERFTIEIRERDHALEDLRRQLLQETAKNATLVHDFDKVNNEADNLRTALLDSQQTIRQLRDQLTDNAQQMQRLNDDLATFRSRSAPPSASRPDVDFTLDDIEHVCVKAIERAQRRPESGTAPAAAPSKASHPISLRDIERACDRAVRHMQMPIPIQTNETQQLLTAAASVPDPPHIQQLIDRCDKLERLLLLYAKFMLKARFRQRRAKTAQGPVRRCWSPGTFRAPTDRVADLDRAIHRMISQCCTLIDQIDASTTVDGHERILNVLAQLDRTQTQLMSIKR